MSVAALTANSNVERMEQQARQFKPELVTLVDEKAAADLRVRLADTNVKVAGGMNGLLEAAAISSADTVIIFDSDWNPQVGRGVCVRA